MDSQLSKKIVLRDKIFITVAIDITSNFPAIKTVSFLLIGILDKWSGICETNGKKIKDKQFFKSPNITYFMPILSIFVAQHHESYCP